MYEAITGPGTRFTRPLAPAPPTSTPTTSGRCLKFQPKVGLRFLVHLNLNWVGKSFETIFQVDLPAPRGPRPVAQCKP